MESQKSKTRTFQIIAYVILILFSVLWCEVSELPEWVIIISALPPIVADIFTDINPRFILKAFIYKERITHIVIGITVLFGVICYVEYPYHKIHSARHFEDHFTSITQFIALGILVGLVMRMLLINLFADMIRAKDIHIAKLLIVLAWVIFIIMAPINARHRDLFSFFISGFGVGFYLHYVLNDKDIFKERRRRKHLSSKVVTLIAEESNEQGHNGEEGEYKKVKVTEEEKFAIELFARKKWKKLQIYLDNNRETVILFFIRVSMLRKLRQYGEAKEIITQELKNPNKSHEHFYHLNYALIEIERFNSKHDWLHRDEIFFHLEKAAALNPDCLLACAIYALCLAIEINTENPNVNENQKRKKALELIEKAMNLYENKHSSKIVSYIIGHYTPVTYTFILDVYAYVLLKCGKTKFARTLILETLFQDPGYSGTYLLLAELYIHLYENKKGNSTVKIEALKKAARLNLLIALEIEKRTDPEKKGTLVSHLAQKLLLKI